MPQTGGDGTSGNYGPKDRLADLISDWQDLQEEVRELREFNQENPDFQYTDALRKARRRLEKKQDRIDNVLSNNPNLVEWANNHGYNTSSTGNTPDTYDDDGGGGGRGNQGGGDGSSGGGGNGRGGGQGGGGSPNTQGQGRGNKLLGDVGKDFTLVRGPNGTYVAVYKYKVNGQTTRVGIKLGKGENVLKKYGLKAGQARRLDKQDFKRIQNIGTADELAPHIRKGDSSVFKAMIRNLERQYPKSWAGSMLRNDEVMSKIIAQRMFGWDQTTFEAQIKDTKWWRTTEPYQREWLTSQSPKQQRNSINRTLEQVVDQLEDYYGIDWQKHVKGGMGQARTWATRIASGIWGEPGAGFEFWADRMFDRAASVENTPAWLQQEQERNAYANTVEDWRERVRAESMSYLGQIKGKPLLDDSTLDAWASGLASTQRSEGDWQGFLRKQMRILHPYFDENASFTDQAAPFKALYESIHGTPTDWDNKFLRSFQATDDKGNPIKGQAMSLYDYELMLRDFDRNPAAWQEGTQLYSEGMDLITQLERTMLGVT